MAKILEYDGVEISYKGKATVKDISVSVEQGEILGIVGESGSGKSTLIKAAMGLLGKDGLVTKGDIWYDGKNLPDLKSEELRQICGKEIGMIFQFTGSSFCPIRTIDAQLYEFIAAHEKITKEEFRKRASELLIKFGFSDPLSILKKYPFELSGGMIQRVGIVAAMMLNPKILLADEPTSALDVTTQKQVVEEISMVREMFGTTIILVTHNIGVVEALADKVLVLKDGKMMDYGDAETILNDPSNEYTKKLMASVPRLRR